MIKGLIREATLAVQAKSGVTTGLIVWLVIAALAALTAFSFFCVAGYVWLTREFGPVFGALVAAGFFLLVTAIAALTALLVRRAAKRRAVLERAAHAHAGSWLLDPKLLSSVVQLGRTLGWQRLVPFALLGILAAQWARESRDHDKREGGK